MLSVVKKKTVRSSASPSERFGRSSVSAREPTRIPIYQGGFHSPFALAHRLTDEWRTWRDLLEFNDVDEPWNLIDEIYHMEFALDAELADELEPDDLELLNSSLFFPDDQPGISTFPRTVRLAGEETSDYEFMIVWAYDAATPRPTVEHGVRVAIGSPRTLTLSPVPIRIKADECFFYALTAGITFDVQIQREFRREFIVMPERRSTS